MPIPREQLRLSAEELDELMTSAREAHVATVSSDGWPHVVPLWFVWHGGHVWVNSLRRSRRGRDLAEGSRVALCVDAGEQYSELRGATFYGRFEHAREEDLDPVRQSFRLRYWNGVDVPQLRSHVWLKLSAEKVVTWDFRKIPDGADRRLEATRSSDA